MGFRMMMHGLVDQVVGAFGGADAAQRESVRERFNRDFVRAISRRSII